VANLSKMPVLFIGHGSPMNAIENNAYTRTLVSLRDRLPRPRAILCISAHWMSQGGTWVTGMERPKTIHDFGGFPQALFDVIYPAPGSPALAQWVCDLVKEPLIQVDLETWGLDHGTWSILCHLYPRADIPVLQLSLDLMKPGSWHFALGEKLRPLREQGILIMGSGNLVHNLRKIRWEANAEPLAWAVECDEWMKAKILARDFAALVKDPTKSDAGKLSIPTAEHYLPMLYVAGASTPDDQCRFEFEGLQNGSISMRSVSFGMPA